jgi:hypothetical protein
MLTGKQIIELASKPKVKKIAVENFLSSLGQDNRDNLANLEMDAALYKWNAATIAAILKGISLNN